jgi:hypothetical protein
MPPRLYAGANVSAWPGRVESTHEGEDAPSPRRLTISEALDLARIPETTVV